jgi:hypothetical protein
VKFLCRLLLAALIIAAPGARAEDGYDLWLRYRPLAGEWLKSDREAARELVPGTPSATLSIAQAEVARGLRGLLEAEPPIAAQPTQDGSLIFGTPASSALVATLKSDGAAGGLGRAGNEGYLIRSLAYEGHRVTVIAANIHADGANMLALACRLRASGARPRIRGAVFPLRARCHVATLRYVRLEFGRPQVGHTRCDHVSVWLGHID